MARRFLTSIDLNKNELQNARAHQLAAAPSAPVTGQFYYDTAANRLYYWNGSAWVAADGSSITYAAPALTLGTTNTAGAANSVIRSDATIAIFDAILPAGQSVGDGSAVGTAAVAARRDHKHGMPAFAVPAVVLGTAAAAGVATTLLRSDATIVAFDATAPSTAAFSAAAATGTAAIAARRDHVHGMPANPVTAHEAAADPHTGYLQESVISGIATPAIALGTAAAAGTGTTPIHHNATIAAFDATAPSIQAIGDAAVVGTVSFAARRDHKHAMPAFASPTAQTAFGATSGAGTAATLPRSDHTHGTPAHDNAAHSAINRSALAAPTADVTWGGFKITNLGAPTADTDAATKAYVDATAQGLDIKASARLASTANVVIATGGLQTIDSVVTVAGNRVLLKNQTTAAENGIYQVNAGAWTRVTDADSSAEVTPGMFVFVEEGTTQADTGWVLTTNAPITLGTTALTFTQFSGAGAYTAGNGLTQSGTTFNVGAGAGVVVGADDVAIDTAVVVRKYATSVGDGAATSFVVTHNLNTQDVVVKVRDNASPFAFMEPDIEATTVNTVTIRFTVAPTTNQYRVIVHA